MMQSGCSDQQLIRDILAGDDAAFRILIERHQKLVWHLVYRMVQHTEDSHELSQEVFLRVYRKLGSFRFESKLSTWIGRIAYNIALRHVQKHRLGPVSLDEEIALADTLTTDADISQQHLAQQDISQLHSALSTLDPLPRTILTLYYLNDLSVAEVADIIDAPVGTVKNALFRARGLLKSKLKHSQELINARS